MAASQVTRSLAGFLQFTMQIAGVLDGTKSSAVGHTDRNSQLLSELSVASADAASVRCQLASVAPTSLSQSVGQGHELGHQSAVCRPNGMWIDHEQRFGATLCRHAGS
jgi:hypothetical protein